MPTILRYRGLRIMIYLNDHAPPHVHVVGADAHANFSQITSTHFAPLRVNTMNFEITQDQFAKGIAAGERQRQRTPLAVAAKYSQGRVHVELNNGCAFVFPAASAQGLAGASVASLKEIEVQGAGLELYWPQLDADLHVPSLLKGVLGTRQWMRELGKAGGSARTDKKA